MGTAGQHTALLRLEEKPPMGAHLGQRNWECYSSDHNWTVFFGYYGKGIHHFCKLLSLLLKYVL